MVLVTEEALAMLLGPPRVFIFLAVLRRFPLPLRRRRAVLDGLVLLARIALLRHRHNARIHYLPAARDVALCIETCGNTPADGRSTPQLAALLGKDAPNLSGSTGR